MAQPEFEAPDFVDNSTPEDIQERMMGNLPEDIDDMPGGFPYDFTMPSAIEKSELLQFHLIRALMAAFPQYAWGEWLDLHGRQVHLERHKASPAVGFLLLSGEVGTEIPAGTVFCVPAADDVVAIEYETDHDCVIGDDGFVQVSITAAEAGMEGNVGIGAISIMNEPVDGITGVTNQEPIEGGADEESDDDFYDRIAAEYDSSRMYLGNDSDYKRWAKEAGAGDCIVDAAADGPGTVKLILVDASGHPAGPDLIKKVYDHIVSPKDRAKRLLPTACANLICTASVTLEIRYTCTGLVLDDVSDMEQVIEEFQTALKALYPEAKRKGVLRYNDVRPLISLIEGVEDFETFLINGNTENVQIGSEEYPETGVCEFG